MDSMVATHDPHVIPSTWKLEIARFPPVGDIGDFKTESGGLSAEFDVDDEVSTVGVMDVKDVDWLTWADGG
jgi:hypothetical protein